MHLSQGQLNLLTLCPRKFQYIYLDQLSTPTPAEQHDRLHWGNRFHLLMQQRELGLPCLNGADDEHQSESEEQVLQQCVAALTRSAPELFQTKPTTFRQSEHRRTLSVQEHLLTVIYDLLILDEQQAQILDWKTYPRPQNPQALSQNWQTRLYPFVLAETSDYQPEQISMTYWFVRASKAQAPEAECFKFAYQTDLHHQTYADLTQLLTQLDRWLDTYQAGHLLPQVSESMGYCETCPFAMRCQRGPTGQAIAFNQIPLLPDIQEVAL